MLVVYEDFDGYGGLDGWQDRSCQYMRVWMGGKSVYEGLDRWQASLCQYIWVWIGGKIDHISI